MIPVETLAWLLASVQISLEVNAQMQRISLITVTLLCHKDLAALEKLPRNQGKCWTRVSPWGKLAEPTFSRRSDP